MHFTLFLAISFVIFFLGLIFKAGSWFLIEVGVSSQSITTAQRISAAIKGIFNVMFSRKILILLKAGFLDVLFQRRTFKESRFRWAMHILIYGGFMLLFFMHALEDFITVSLFEDYASTLNPFLFLRNLFGIFVIIGLALALYRRTLMRLPHLYSNMMDYYAIGIIAVIMISGIFLEGSKILSHRDFMRMAEDYAALEEGDDELRSLESYWVREFNVISANVTAPFDPEVLAEGLEVHEMNCAGCHSSPKWAFASFATAKAFQPMALALERFGISTLFYYIHILACFIGLAYLPFSKMFHILATPISLLASAVMDWDTSHPANISTRQAMELDACMHCGTCGIRCSAGMAYEVRGNRAILPSEKIGFLRRISRKGALSRSELKSIQEGITICTNCDRCTVVCPAGITLKELWVRVREDLLRRGAVIPEILSPFSFFRGLCRGRLSADNYKHPLDKTRSMVAGRFESLANKQSPILLGPDHSLRALEPAPNDTFKHCFTCQNCTTVCPVVKSCDNPEEALDLVPHQIMCALGLGLTEMATGPRMLWDCVTCYQCQEHCPQKVRVTDLLYDLKNLAVKHTAHS